jgi:aspartate kinase
MKFGGTSVGSAQRIQGVAAIVKNNLSAKPVVVVSAMAGVTNTLIEIAQASNVTIRTQKLETLRVLHESVVEALGLSPSLLDTLFEELETLAKKTKKSTKKTLDHFVSFGERLCAPLVAGALVKAGVPSAAFPSWEVGMITDEQFGAAEPLATTPALIRRHIESLTVVPVITGYVGKTEKGEITTLGRGGSDYSAAVIGAALLADAIQIWKEVDGFMTTDPRLIPEARVVPELAFEEAAELAYFGAKVLHPKTILPAMKAGVPVEVLNTFNPEGKGTRIVSNFKERRQVSQAVDALTLKRNVSVLHVFSPDFFDGNKVVADILNLFSNHNVNIGDMALSVASLSMIIDSSEPLPPKIIEGLKKIGDIEIHSNKAMICAVGGSMHAADVAGRMFTVLGQEKVSVEFISQASSGYSITFVVNADDAEKALKTLHKEYIRP